MARRTVALWKDQFIGIESIFTVIHGKQVNIPDKIKELREKSRRGELFCPCGCGSNLILVAGDRMLREQHFRIKDGEGSANCTYIEEGRVSVDSKIVLKCWLEEQLGTRDILSRVPVCDLGDSQRRYEFTFLSREKGIGLSYCHERINRSEEKLRLLDENSAGIHVIYVDDVSNLGTQGQYPEGLMKVQDRQGYCLILEIEGMDYFKARLSMVVHEQDLDGFWQEKVLASGSLRDFTIGEEGRLSFQGVPLKEYLARERARFLKEQERERRRRQEEEKRRQEAEERRRLEAERRRQEAEERRREAEERRRQEEERYIQEQRRLAEEKERKRLEWEERERAREEQFRQSLETELDQQEHQVRDPAGNRWIRCEYCGKIAMDQDFRSYGGPGRINLGICKECAETNPEVQKRDATPPERKESRLMTCPLCGGKLVERSGPYGPFLGCAGYPRCRYVQRLPRKRL